MNSLTVTYVDLPGDQKAVQLTWFLMAGAVSYNIYRNGACISGLPIVANTYTDTLSSQFKYLYYQVAGLDGAGTEIGRTPIVINVDANTEYLCGELRRLLKDPHKRRWSDEELITYLDQGMWMMNGFPPFTAYPLEVMPDSWRGLVLLGAQSAAYMAQAGYEIAKEFTYSDMSLSIGIERSQKYNALASATMQSFSTGGTAMKKAWLLMVTGPAALLTNPLAFKIRTFSPMQWRIR